jgi:hypothetical protein
MARSTKEGVGETSGQTAGSTFGRACFPKTGPAEETGFLRSVRNLCSAISPGPKPGRNLVLTCSPTPSFPGTFSVPMAAPSAPGILISPDPLHSFLDRPRRVPGGHSSRSCAAAHRHGAPAPIPLRDFFCKHRVFRSTRANARRCNGYRCTKRNGKPVFTNRHLSLQDRHFCDSMSARPSRAFTPRSSRYLNCPSNLIGHDHPNKPANGVGNNGTF